MGKLLAQVIPLAFGAAISPALLTVAVLTISSPRRGLVRGFALAAGVVTALLVLTALGLTVLSHVTDHPSATKAAVSDAIDIVIGLVLLALALRGLLVRRNPQGSEDDADTPRHAAPVGLLATFGAGAALMVTNVTTIILYLPAMKDVAKADVSDGAKALAIVIAVLITALPVLLPLGLRLVAPRASERWLGSLNSTISRHRHAFIVGVEIIFGVYLLVKGL
jgi:threonine/homoserine/homoserine lactone efflux protein